MKGSRKKIKKDEAEHPDWDRIVNADEIQVKVIDGTVILTGPVMSYLAKLLASENSWNISGVWSVDNRLKVRYPLEANAPSGEMER